MTTLYLSPSVIHDIWNIQLQCRLCIRGKVQVWMYEDDANIPNTVKLCDYAYVRKTCMSCGNKIVNSSSPSILFAIANGYIFRRLRTFNETVCYRQRLIMRNSSPSVFSNATIDVYTFECAWLALSYHNFPFSVVQAQWCSVLWQRQNSVIVFICVCDFSL